MADVTIRDLRNHGGEVIDRVVKGERLTITRDGHPVAELGPVGRPPIPLATLIQRWARLPLVNPVLFREDVDDVVDAAL